MARIYDKKENAVLHKVKDNAADSTLEKIAAKYKDNAKLGTHIESWKEIAAFNWGTIKPEEVNRALLETVGVGAVDDKNPEKTVLAASADLPAEILIPKSFEMKDLALKSTYKVKVKPGPKAANAISITNLDKWFIPGEEECEIKYLVEGLAETADKVDFEVHGSKYCECEDYKEGFGKYKLLPGEILFKEEKIAPKEREASDLKVKDDKGEAAWKGQVSTTKGILSIKTDDDKTRFINVAFSPYTVLLRYYKDVADVKARLHMDPFWPQWDKDQKLVPDSLKIKWKVLETDKFKKGLGSIVILDGADKVVFRKPLKPADLAKKTEDDDCFSFAWDGKYSDGKNSKDGKEVIVDDLPYRLRIEAHTPVDEANGLALCAMHTEVRLYVHKDTHLTTAENYDPRLEPASMNLGIAPLYAKEPLPKKDDGTVYFQYKLAEGGFHPGPVDGTRRKEYNVALKEFQRSIPKHNNGGGDYSRLPISANGADAAEDGDSKTTLEHFPTQPEKAEELPSASKSRVRPWFGDSSLGDLPRDEELDKLLTDKDKELVAWVEDRQYYTGGSADADIVGKPETMNNYRGGMSIGDGKTDKDLDAIPRPFLPFQVDFILLSKKKKLTEEMKAPEKKEDKEKLRRLIGPLRVDWSFYDIAHDISEVSYPGARKDRVRTRSYLEWIFKKNEKKHTRKDVKFEVVQTNCLTTYGGLRTSTTGDYYDKCFAYEDISLMPWKAKKQADVESITTVAHDLLDKKENFWKNAVGRAGVFFHPSIIAGDGYQVRAQVRLKKTDFFEFPNLEFLEKRYHKAPQVTSAKIRMWRKASIRGYIRWAPAGKGNWGANDDGLPFVDQYRMCHVHFVHESQSPKEFALNTLFNTSPGSADVTLYKDMVANRVTVGSMQDKTKMSLNPDYPYPWADDPCMGYAVLHGPDLSMNDGYKEIRNAIIDQWRLYRERVIFELLCRVEKKSGLMRGHLLVDFLCSPGFYVEEYKTVDGTGTDVKSGYWMIRKKGSPSGSFEDAPFGGNTLKKTGEKSGNIDDLGFPAVGALCGATWVFLTHSAGIPKHWAHEVGHHRHMQHAAEAPGANVSQHDSKSNSIFAWPPATDAKAKNWDVFDTMAYTREFRTFDGKSTLKQRGWKVEGLPLPPSDKNDDDPPTP